MTLSPSQRKLVLTIHVLTSVAWLGALLAYLVLDISAVANIDPQTVRAAYLAMNLITRCVIVPLAIASILFGAVNALGTPWGLFRHYWVLLKLLLTLFATTILLLETQTIDYMAEIASSSTVPRNLHGSLPHSIGGIVVLLIIMVLAIYKPPGVTPYGWRKQRERDR
ncbi:MAG: DUF2269 domain-containing protein [Proteobacteria bacterium]|jgi:hypothetical protein|nr:DUF2269 domain-containing protein [Pseudomonadota bacterium]